MGAFTIAAKDLRLRIRDKSAWIIAIVAPFALAAIISLAFKGEGEFHTTMVVADEDSSEISEAFVSVLTTPDVKKIITLRIVDSAQEASALTEGEKVSAGLVIPPGFGQAVVDDGSPNIIVIKHPNSPIAASVAENIARRFASETDSVRLSVATTLSESQTSVGPDEIARRAAERSIPTSVRAGTLGKRGENTSSSYFAPAMAIFFVFFTVSFGGLSMIQERRLGTMQRLIAAPMPSVQIIFGKIISTFAIGVVSLTTMVLSTSWLLGSDWGNPIAVAGLILAIVFAAMGIMSTVAVFSKTEERAGALSSIVVLALSLLGGNFMPISQAPKIFRTLALFTPNGWALRGFTDLVADGGGIASVTTHIAIIVGFGLVTGLVALSQTRRLIAR